jgi:hypothetical protein
MGVRGGPSMAGNVLENRQDAALLQPLGHGAGDRGDLGRLGAIGPVADDRIGAINRDVRQRQTINGNPKFCEVGSDQLALRRAAERPAARSMSYSAPKTAPGG